MTPDLIVPKYDVAIALGSGLNSEGEIALPDQRRLDKLVELYKEGASQTLLISHGTGPQKAGIPEAQVFKNYLESRGIPSEQILIEGKSKDTIENAFYSRFDYTDPRGYKHPLVVTSQFHMPRSEGIFQWVLDASYNPEFEAVSDVGIDSEKLRKRQGIEEMIIDFNERVLFPNIGRGDLVSLGAFILDPENRLRMEYKEFLDSFKRGPDALYGY